MGQADLGPIDDSGVRVQDRHVAQERREEPMPNSQQDEHEFMVAGVEAASGQTNQGIAVTLIDARGGRVRLHLSTGMAELLRDQVSSALQKTEGPADEGLRPDELNSSNDE
jgi:hypothetical protein